MFNFLTAKMAIPQPYGWFHIMFICITLALTIFISIYFKNCSDKIFRRIIFILWAIIMVLELYKELVLTFDCNPKGVYKMFLFPFQFCSLALFAYPFIIFGKESKFRDALLLLSATFIFFGGFGLYLVPTSFQEYVGVNIQTMVHHGTQVIVGIFIVVHEHKKFTIKNFLNTMLCFVGVLIIAISLNEIVFPLLPADNCDFNLFYISRHVVNQLPVLAPIWEASYIGFLATYIFGFAGISFVLYLVEKYLYNFVGFLKGKLKHQPTHQE